MSTKKYTFTIPVEIAVYYQPKNGKIAVESYTVNDHLNLHKVQDKVWKEMILSELRKKFGPQVEGAVIEYSLETLPRKITFSPSMTFSKKIHTFGISYDPEKGMSLELKEIS